MRRDFIRQIITLLILSINCNNLLSQNEIKLSQINEYVSISNKVGILEDSTSSLTIDDVINSNLFSNNQENIINKPPEASYWLKFSLKNDLNEYSNHYLTLTSNDVFYIDFFLFNEDFSLKKKIATGNKRKFSKRPLKTHSYSFPILLNVKEINYIYLKLDRKYQVLNTNILLESEASLINNQANRLFKSGFSVGIISIFLIIAIVLFFFSRSLINLNYILYILGAVTFILSFNEGFRFIWYNFPYLQDPLTFVGPSIVLIGHIGVFITFFEIRKFNTHYFLFFNTLRIISVVLIIGFLLIDTIKIFYHFLFQVMAVLYLLYFISIIIIGYLSYLNNKKKDKLWFLASIILLILSATVIFLVELGHLDRGEFGLAFDNLPIITIYYEATFFAVFLTKKIYDEKIIYEKKLLEERQIIIEGLHDDVISSFSGVKTSFTNLRSKTTDKSSFLRIENNLDKILNKIRDLTHDYNNNSNSLDEIIADVRLYANEVLENNNINFEFEYKNDVEDLKLPLSVNRNLKGFFKEIIHNTVKHSQSKNFNMTILKTNNIIDITLSDDGIGIDSSSQKINGIGLKNIKNRARRMKAKHYKMYTKPNEGLSYNLILDMEIYKDSDYI